MLHDAAQMNQKIAAFLKSTLQVSSSEFGMPLEQVNFCADMNAAIQLAAIISARYTQRGYYFKLEILMQAQPPVFTADFQRRTWLGLSTKAAYAHADPDPAIAICTAVLALINSLAIDQ